MSFFQILHFVLSVSVAFAGGMFLRGRMKIRSVSDIKAARKKKDLSPPPLWNPADADGAERYADIYRRLLDYFDEKKPYLDPELKEGDVATALFTNRVYLAKALKGFARVSFPTFTSRYRVMHATKLFLENPTLRVADLYEMCGFKSYSTFCIAFKLFMNVKPKEWCDSQRGNLPDR